VAIHVRAKAPQLARKEGETLRLPVGPGEHLVRDYASLSRRRLDVLIHAQNVTETDWTVHLPPGMRAVGLPRPAEGSSPFGSFKVEVESGGTAVRVKTTIRMTKRRVWASDYASFRAFCESADQALGQHLVVAGGK
jgi:cellulose synthase operon protein C